MTVKIFIGNLPEDSDQDEMHKMFLEHGTVVECHVCGRFGFVHMESKDEAQSAISAINGTMYHGRRINVELSTGVNRRNEPGWKEGSSGGGGRSGSRGPRGDRGDFGGRGGRGGRDRFGPYSRSDPYGRDPYDSYSRRSLDPYDDPRSLSSLRDPYRDPYSRLAELRDPYLARLERDLMREPLRLRDPYARPPPEYYGDSSYSGRSSSPERERFLDLLLERRARGELTKSNMSEREQALVDRAMLREERSLSSLDRPASRRSGPDGSSMYAERKLAEKSYGAGGSYDGTEDRTPWSRPQNGQSGGGMGGMGGIKPRSLMSQGSASDHYGNGTYS